MSSTGVLIDFLRYRRDGESEPEAGKSLLANDFLLAFVVTPQNQLVRLDFEHARRVTYPALAKKRYGTMIGVLVGTYIIVVQPDLGRAISFAKRLVERLSPPVRVLSVARAKVEQLLNGQLRVHGIDSRLELPW